MKLFAVGHTKDGHTTVRTTGNVLRFPSERLLQVTHTPGTVDRLSVLTRTVRLSDYRPTGPEAA